MEYDDQLIRLLKIYGLRELANVKPENYGLGFNKDGRLKKIMSIFPAESNDYLSRESMKGL